MSEYFRKYIKKENFSLHPTSIKFKTTFQNCILEAMKKRMWKEVETDDWDINWAEKEWIYEFFDHAHVTANQQVNHHRNHYELTRKDLMIQNIQQYQQQLQKEGQTEELLSFNFTPITYMLPSEYSIFCQEFQQYTDSKTLWIMKPISKAQGKGIFLFQNIKDISNWKSTYRYNPENPQAEPYVVQKYISEPLLIGGKQFDMRIYALCTSYNPLTVYLYRTGFARFTHIKYDLDDINNLQIHLTNVAIQQTSENYDDKIGGQWYLQELKLYLISRFGQEKVSDAFFSIQNIIIRALQSVQKIINGDQRCFELYGFDVLFDSQLRPWLLEVNASPSMTANTPQDSDVKIGLLDDVFTILDLQKILTGQQEQIGGFDLIYQNGNSIKLPSNSTYSSLLGCYNNRHQQLKQLAQSTAVRLSHSNAETHLRPAQNLLNENGNRNQNRNVKGNPNMSKYPNTTSSSNYSNSTNSSVNSTTSNQNNLYGSNTKSNSTSSKPGNSNRPMNQINTNTNNPSLNNGTYGSSNIYGNAPGGSVAGGPSYSSSNNPSRGGVGNLNSNSNNQKPTGMNNQIGTNNFSNNQLPPTSGSGISSNGIPNKYGGGVGGHASPIPQLLVQAGGNTLGLNYIPSTLNQNENMGYQNSNYTNSNMTNNQYDYNINGNGKTHSSNLNSQKSSNLQTLSNSNTNNIHSNSNNLTGAHINQQLKQLNEQRKISQQFQPYQNEDQKYQDMMKTVDQAREEEQEQEEEEQEEEQEEEEEEEEE